MAVKGLWGSLDFSVGVRRRRPQLMRHKESLALGERARRGEKSPSGHRAKKKKNPDGRVDFRVFTFDGSAIRARTVGG